MESSSPGSIHASPTAAPRSLKSVGGDRRTAYRDRRRAAARRLRELTSNAVHRAANRDEVTQAVVHRTSHLATLAAHALARAQAFRKLVKWRNGSGGRISHRKHRYGWDLKFPHGSGHLEVGR